jgi:hypothetical protein
VRRLSVRPLAALDRGYGNANFVNQTQSINCDLLLRLASNRCVYGAPTAYKGRGAPNKHGHKFKFNDPETWPDADEAMEVEDDCHLPHPRRPDAGVPTGPGGG